MFLPFCYGDYYVGFNEQDRQDIEETTHYNCFRVCKDKSSRREYQEEERKSKDNNDSGSFTIVILLLTSHISGRLSLIVSKRRGTTRLTYNQGRCHF